MSSKMLDAALDYAARGWPVFPCKHNKTPYTTHGVVDATTETHKIREWWGQWPGANVAVNCGEAGLLVLDYDPGSSIEAVRAAIPDIQETKRIACTPRGGQHHFFQLQPGDRLVPSTTNTFSEHVDVRSFRGYVLLPPSRTKDGEYTWENEGAMAPRSNTLLDVCGRAREKSQDHDNWIIEPDIEENIARARAWLRGEIKIGNDPGWCQSAIQEAGGDNTTFKTAAMMKSCGLSEGTAWELMHDVYNHEPTEGRPGCSPPWEYEELGGKVANGYEYNSSPPGNVTGAYQVAKMAGLFGPAKETPMGEGWEMQSGPFRTINRQAMEVVADPRFLVPETIPEQSYAMLVGPNGSYKTFIALDMALTIATGGPTGDWRGLWQPPNIPGPVLFMAGEGRFGIKKRVRAWEKQNGVVAEQFYLTDPVPHIEQRDLVIKFIDDMLRKVPGGFRLVVLDTVARATQSMSVNADETATGFTALADQLRRGLGCAVLALHHTGHGNPDRARGSSAFLGDPDTILVAAQYAPQVARVSMTKQKDWEVWRKSRWANMMLVGDTLVPALRDAPKDVAKQGETLWAKSKRETLGTSLERIGQYVIQVLEKNPTKKWTNEEVAGTCSGHNTLDLHTHQNQLSSLKIHSEIPAWQCWHPEDGGFWRFEGKRALPKKNA